MNHDQGIGLPGEFVDRVCTYLDNERDRRLRGTWVLSPKAQYFALGVACFRILNDVVIGWDMLMAGPYV